MKRVENLRINIDCQDSIVDTKSRIARHSELSPYGARARKG
jgi:hypothetical protein